jgi:hypothetical protein
VSILSFDVEAFVKRVDFPAPMYTGSGINEMREIKFDRMV